MLRINSCAGAARHAFLAKAGTPGTSDVDAALDERAEEYIALLLGLINALPKAQDKNTAAADKNTSSPANPSNPAGNFPADLRCPQLCSCYCCGTCVD